MEALSECGQGLGRTGHRTNEFPDHPMRFIVGERKQDPQRDLVRGAKWLESGSRVSVLINPWIQTPNFGFVPLKTISNFASEFFFAYRYLFRIQSLTRMTLFEILPGEGVPNRVNDGVEATG